MVAAAGPAQRMLDPNQSYQEGRKLFQYLSAVISGWLTLQCGMTLAWTSPTLPYLTSKDSFVLVNEEQSSWISSLLAIGAFVGAVPAGKIADKIGRKRAILIQTFPSLLSWGLIIFAQDVITLYIARFIGGMASGAICVLAPIYIGEIAETSIRGALGTSFQLLFAFGILYTYVLGSILTYTVFAVTCALLIIPFLVGYPFLPESPTWLVQKGRKIDAVKALEKLRGPDYDTKAEISALQVQADEQESKRGGLRDVVGTRGGRRAMVACLGLMVFQQLSGIDAVLFYTVSIFEDAGSTIDPTIATILIGVIEVVMAVVTTLVIDKAGRRPLLLLSSSVMAICLAVLGYYFKLKAEKTDVSQFGWLPLASLASYNVFFAIGYGSIPWMLVSELFPPETKGVASSMSIMLNWSLVFAVTKLFPTMEMHFGSAITFWIFGGLMILATFFTLFFIPETKGKPLQQIQDELNGVTPVDIPLQTLSSGKSVSTA